MSRLRVVLAVLVASCAKPVANKAIDRSTPEAAARAAIAALNSGSMEELKRVVGNDFFEKKATVCGSYKNKPPERPSAAMGAEAADAFFQAAVARYEAKCDQLENEFTIVLESAKRSAGYKLIKVGMDYGTGMVEVTVAAPSGSGEDRWNFKKVGGEWFIDEEHFGWPAGNLIRGYGTQKWLADEQVKKALQ